jgi:hypothetical protein
VIDITSESRMVALLEALLAEQRRMAEAHHRALADHARATAASEARTRATLRGLGAIMLGFCAMAALVQSWPALRWLMEG